MTYTPDQVISAIIFEGQIERHNTSPETEHPVITPRGIQIALATAIVESHDRVLANPHVPESESYPNDGDGTDHESAGPFQQQHQWWGTVAEEMDPRLSAAMFYNHLAKMPYNDGNISPGTFAQRVQQSAYPDRYDLHWNEAVAQYNRLAAHPIPPAVAAVQPPKFNEVNQLGRSNNFSSRHGRTVDLLIAHTEEPLLPMPRPPGAAQRLADLIKHSEGTGNPVSYHYSIGQNPDGSVDVIDIGDTDLESWAVLDSNPDSINYCLAESSVSLTTDQWMRFYGNAIDVMAYLMVQDAHKYGVPIRFLFPLPDNNNRYPGPPPGITDHKYVTKFLGDGSHTDVGANFPFPYLGDRINHYAGQGDTDDMALIKQASGSIYRDSNDLLPWEGTAMDFIIDAQTHEGRVEALAIEGFPPAVELVRRTAEGRSPVNGNLSDDQRAHAASILSFIAGQPKPRAPRKPKA